MPPFDYEALMSNPIAAMGMGLLTSDNPQDGLRQGMGLLSQGSQMKRQKQQDELQRKLLEYKMQEAANGGLEPAAVRTYKFLDSLPPDKQALFMNSLRGDPTVNLGNAIGVRNQMGGLREIFPVQPKPDEMPAFKGEQAEATAIGKAEGEAQGAIEKKYIQAPQIEDLLKQAEVLLPNATSGGMATNARDLSGWAGYATDGSEADSQLDVIGAALTSGVPRMEGPQSNFDVKLYEKAAGDLANSKLPRERRQAALKTIRNLNNKYMRQPAADGDTGLAPLPVAPDKNAALEELRRRGIVK